MARPWNIQFAVNGTATMIGLNDEVVIATQTEIATQTDIKVEEGSGSATQVDIATEIKVEQGDGDQSGGGEIATEIKAEMMRHRPMLC